jgi:hypothetical protein
LVCCQNILNTLDSSWTASSGPRSATPAWIGTTAQYLPDFVDSDYRHTDPLADAVNNKLMFSRVMRALDVPHPRVFGYLHRGWFHPIDPARGADGRGHGAARPARAPRPPRPESCARLRRPRRHDPRARRFDEALGWI